MNCKIISNNIFFYLDNELSEEKRINFESHLKLCPQCKVLFENVASTYNLILEENQVAVNPFFYHKLKAKIETKEESHIIKVLSNVLKPLAIAASVALGIMIGNGELDVLNITIDDTEIISENFTPVLPADYSLWITMNEEDGSEN
jgi:predicted anti-sigma-YlaC factor YlaD